MAWGFLEVGIRFEDIDPVLLHAFGQFPRIN